MEGSNSLVIVHIGAGSHSLQKNDKYKQLIRKALQVNDSKTVLAEVSKKLERSVLTNTGYGSSLNLIGEVQCDASFISYNREDKYTSMGVMYNIVNKYPITETLKCFKQLNTLYSTGFKSFGLARPLIFDHCQKKLLDELTNNNEDVDKETLVSTKSQRIYDTYKHTLMSDYNQTSNELNRIRNEIQDTIGIIHIGNTNTEIATSSGGNFFKFPGRIGCAGVLGAAIGHHTKNGISVSCMCSGNGEDIIMMDAADRIVNNMINDFSEDYCELLVNIILQASTDLPLTAVDDYNNKMIYIGAICIIHDLNSGVKRLVYCHSTESFYFGFRSHNNKPEVILSRLDSDKVGHVFVRGEFKI
ncbi:uncharacterized protein AC631_05707 [Debaryomyces fabryi]|uniref:Uncharacterized protein n=1 Tax=Debaryomyces fabryi TaxID=58627 RepID=A0A0V1PQM3_9ASCO|nr:uncharacterized protein AC631_05707 [Debaryomyces fabryi]KRZ98528.1 hypothetical protein AC631_05707 [Debaryomyces fabryi]CUM45844.1 unnamed protein product [Debaryomyces fabryi]